MTIDDLYSDLEPHAVPAWNKDMAVTKGVRSVKNSIIGLVTTAKGSRAFDPECGCDITSELFENITPLSAQLMKQSITDTIRNYEPRVNQLAVETRPLYDRNEVNVLIMFSVVDSPDVLEQIRLNMSM